MAPLLMGVGRLTDLGQSGSGSRGRWPEPCLVCGQAKVALGTITFIPQAQDSPVLHEGSLHSVVGAQHPSTSGSSGVMSLTL